MRFTPCYRVPVDGEYVVRVALAGLRPAASEPIAVTLWVDDHLVQTIPFDPERSATFNDDRQDFGGQMVEFKAHLTAGDRHIAVAIPRIFEGLPPSYSGSESVARGRSLRRASSSRRQTRRPSGSLSCARRSTIRRLSSRRFR